jgi:hypothetical protein
VTMNITNFMDVTPCSLIEVYWRFVDATLLVPVDSLWAYSEICNWAFRSRLAQLAWLTFRPWRWRQYIPLKCQWTTVPHGLTSQKREHFRRRFYCIKNSTKKVSKW